MPPLRAPPPDVGLIKPYIDLISALSPVPLGGTIVTPYLGLRAVPGLGMQAGFCFLRCNETSFKLGCLWPMKDHCGR